MTNVAVDYLEVSAIASRLYQVWAGLQDRYELKSAAAGDVVAKMRDAAREWGLACEDQARVVGYLERWEQIVLG